MQKINYKYTGNIKIKAKFINKHNLEQSWIINEQARGLYLPGLEQKPLL
jgi:hypothetical protein